MIALKDMLFGWLEAILEPETRSKRPVQHAPVSARTPDDRKALDRRGSDGGRARSRPERFELFGD